MPPSRRSLTLKTDAKQAKQQNTPHTMKTYKKTFALDDAEAFASGIKNCLELGDKLVAIQFDDESSPTKATCTFEAT